MIVVANSRSSAVSTAVTRAGESWSPQGVCLPKAWRNHSEKSASPTLAVRAPSASYTQWRGNLEAPTSSCSAEPSARMVRRRVVHTTGARNWTKGGWLTRRGEGRPVRPPTVCRKVAAPSAISGSAWMVGREMGWNTAAFLPTRTVVEFRKRPPVYDASAMLPASSTSMTALRWLANR